MPINTDAYYLSESDRSKFSELWKEHFRMYGRPKRHGEEQEYQAADFYVAKTPNAGIAALVGSKPGYASCQIYQTHGNGVDKEIEIVDGFELDVYNISLSTIDGNTFVLVSKDKYGTWHVITGGGGSGVEFWAELIFKIPLVPPHYTEYYAIRVTDTDHDVKLHWVEIPDSEGDGDDPNTDFPLSGTGTNLATGTAGNYADVLLCYEANNCDIPYVPPLGSESPSGSGSAESTNDEYPPGSPYGYQRAIVLLRPGGLGVPENGVSGSGSGTPADAVIMHYIFEQGPRWEFIRPISVRDSEGYQTADLLRYNQETKQHEIHESIIAFDVNGDDNGSGT